MISLSDREENIVVTSIFSFSQNVFKSLLFQDHLTLSCIYTHFITMKKKILENIVEKGEIAQNEQFHLSHNVFYAICILKSFNIHISVVVCSFIKFGTVSKWCTRECVNPFPNKPWFLCVCSTSLLKTLWEEEKLLVTSNFSFSHGVFNCFGELPVILIKFEIVVCILFKFGRVSNLSLGRGVKVRIVW